MPSVPAMCRGGSAWAFQSKTEKEKQAWSSCDASTNRSSGLFESRSRSNFDPQPDKDRNAAAFGGSGLSSCITLLRVLASFGRRPMEPWPSSAFAAMRRGVQSGSSLYGRGRLRWVNIHVLQSFHHACVSDGHRPLGPVLLMIFDAEIPNPPFDRLRGQRPNHRPHAGQRFNACHRIPYSSHLRAVV